MPKCISCNEVYADQLRRCPHCGYAPEADSVGGDGSRGPRSRRRKARGPRARRRQAVRVALLACLLGVGLLGSVISWPRSPDARDDLVGAARPVVGLPTSYPSSLPPPDEIEAGAITDGLQITSAEATEDDLMVAGTCSPRAVARITVEGRPAVLTPAGDGFSVHLPVEEGTVEVVAKGVRGDTAKLSQEVQVKEPVPPSERVRLISHADGSTVYARLVKLTIAPVEGMGPAREERFTLDGVENHLRLPGGVFTLYRAPAGLKFLRIMPEGAYAFLREIDEQEMVLIPAGVAKRGMGQEIPHGPEHFVRLDAFLIDRTEVSCGQYARFLRYMSRVEDSSMLYLDDPGIERRPVGWKTDEPPPGTEEYPVTGIAWYAAYAYARWVGGRLPTETEWERAAAGAGGRAYPWGNEFDRARCRWQETGPAPADSMPGGAGPSGLLHMSGNVREWCFDRFDPRWYLRGTRTNPRGPASTLHRVVRGGSFLSPREALRLQHRDHYDPTRKASDLGFRVARNWIDLKKQGD